LMMEALVDARVMHPGHLPRNVLHPEFPKPDASCLFLVHLSVPCDRFWLGLIRDCVDS
jgi:hypothetical protein